jgi:hypothetical protein
MSTTFAQLASQMCLRFGFARIAPTKQNELAIVTWAAYEGSNAWCNALDDTQPMPGSWPLKGNTAHVQNYTSVSESLDAYLITLGGHNWGYPAIMAALAKGDCACEVTEAVANSEWGTWFHNPKAAVEAVGRVNADFSAYANRVVVGS